MVGDLTMKIARLMKDLRMLPADTSEVNMRIQSMPGRRDDGGAEAGYRVDIVERIVCRWKYIGRKSS